MPPLELQAAGANDPPDQPDAEDAREEEPQERDQVDSHELWAFRVDDAENRRPDEAPGDDERYRDPVDRVVDVEAQLVDARVADLHLQPPLARLLDDVAHLIGQLARHGGELAHL